MTVLIALSAASCASDLKERRSAPAQKQEQKEEALPDADFTSPDMGLWQLYGPVESAVFESRAQGDSQSQTMVSVDSVAFNPKGLLTAMAYGMIEPDAKTPQYYTILVMNYDEQGNFLSGKETADDAPALTVKLARSSGGYITVLQVLGSDGELSEPTSFHRLIEWKNGVPFIDETEEPEGLSKSHFTYSDRGIPSESTLDNEFMGGELHAKTTYEYKEFDRYGNWTSRVAHRTGKSVESEADGTNSQSTDIDDTFVETRRIHYRPPDSP